ncbi:hypothetical protein [Roseobacter sp. A03A-229]
MKVKIKEFKVEMDVKNSGIELQVRDNDGTLRGDCYVTKTGLIWCKGQTTRQNGVKMSWDDFIAQMEAQDA